MVMANNIQSEYDSKHTKDGNRSRRRRQLGNGRSLSNADTCGVVNLTVFAAEVEQNEESKIHTEWIRGSRAVFHYST